MPSTLFGSLPRMRTLATRGLIPIAVALVLLASYWYTLAPTVTRGDAGELSTVIRTMGVAHPTGYPLYLMVGKLFDLIPVGDAGRTAAFFSAVSAAAAGGVMSWLVVSITASGPAGALAGLALGLNWWVWPQANQPEVYALHIFLATLVVAMFVRWLPERSPRRLNLLAFFCGLALTHHRTALFFVAPALLWAAVATRPISARVLVRAAVCGALPLLLYLWLPFRSAFKPPFDWGNTSGSLARFFEHISGGLYARLAFGDTAANAWDQTKLLGLRLWRQFGLVGMLLVATGLVGMVRSRQYRPLGVALTVNFALIAVWAAFYKVPDKEVFYLPCMVAVAAWLGFGLSYGLLLARELNLSSSVLRLAPAAAVLVSLFLPLNMLVDNWNRADRSQQYATLEGIAVSMLNVPPDAVILLTGDEPMGGTLYYWYVLHPQSAPLVLSADAMTYRWYREQLPAELRAAVEETIRRGPEGWERALVLALRDSLAPERPLYTNLSVTDAPPGYVVLRTPPPLPLNRVVAAPGVPEAPDAGRPTAILQFPDGAGALLDVEVPDVVTRGEPFTVTAAIRWAGSSVADNELLRFEFVHDSIAAAWARGDMGKAPKELGLSVATPLLFGAALPASRPGYHYRQTMNALLSRRMTPGAYRAFVQLVRPGSPRQPIPLGAVAVR